MQVDRAIKIAAGDLKQLVQDHPNLPQYVPTWKADADTSFIFKVRRYGEFLPIRDELVGHSEALKAVATRRWFNQRVSAATEFLLCKEPGIEPNPGPYHTTIDLYVDGTPFDVKVCCLPGGWSRQRAINDPEHLIEVLYDGCWREEFCAA